jgi:hypothetical protein
MKRDFRQHRNEYQRQYAARLVEPDRTDLYKETHPMPAGAAYIFVIRRPEIA